MSKKEDSKLSDEFQKEIKESRKSKNYLGVLLALIAIVVIFGTVGVAVYQFVYKPDVVNNKSADQKIESRPEEEVTKPVETPAPAVTPPAATTTTPPVSTTTGYTNYTVKSGDTWSSIANDNNMKSTDLMTYNGATAEMLAIGQVIKIPKS